MSECGHQSTRSISADRANLENFQYPTMNILRFVGEYGSVYIT